MSRATDGHQHLCGYAVTTRDDRGFTLIEMIVAVVITGIVSAVMLEAMFVGLRTIDDTNKRIAGSNDTQLIAGYFTADVASAITISTSGTRVHESPSVSTVANGVVVSFWSLNSISSTTLQAGLSQGWNQPSLTRFRIAMANEAISPAGPTGTRAAASASPTSSITHTVALTPTSGGAIARRDAKWRTTTATGGETSLLFTSTAKPATAQSDRLLAHVAVAGGSTTLVSPPTGWTPVTSRASGSGLRSLIFQKVATSSEPDYKWDFTDASGKPVAREAAIGIASFSGVLSTVCATPEPGCGLNEARTDANPCGGETPILLLSWTDRRAYGDPNPDKNIEVSYSATAVGSETQLVRRRCEAATGTQMSGIPKSEQTLATNLTPAASFASCVSSPPSALVTSTTSSTSTTSTTTAAGPDFCSYLPVTVMMSLSEVPLRNSPARTYLVRATTRTDREAE